MRLLSLVWTVSCLWQSTLAVFQDEAFSVDYHHALLGIPQAHATFFYRPQSSSNASLLFSLSDKGVLGAINPKDGNILWRQVLTDDLSVSNSTSFLVGGERDGQIISGYGNSVSCWDAAEGRLNWEYVTGSGSVVKGLQTVALKDSTQRDVVVLVGPSSGDAHYSVTRLASISGTENWQHTDTSIASGSDVSLATSSDSIYVVSKSHGLLAGSKAKVSHINIETGKETTSSSVAVDGEGLGGAGQLTMGSCAGHPFVVSSEKPFKTVKATLLGQSKVNTLTPDDKGEEIMKVSIVTSCSPATPHFLVHVIGKERQWAEVYHLNLKNGDATRAYSLPATGEHSTFALQTVGAETYIVRSTESEVTLYSWASHGQLGRWPRKGFRSVSVNRAATSHANAEVVSGKSGFAVRVAEYVEGHLSLVRNGETQWARPELLAYAQTARFVDAVPQDSLMEELDAEASVNPLTAYVHRVSRHVRDLQGLPSHLQSSVKRLLPGSEDVTSSIKQTLTGDKRVVLGTTQKFLVAVDATAPGVVLWQIDLSPTISADANFNHMTSEAGRTTAYLSDGSLVAVNTTSGDFIEYLPGTIHAARTVEIAAQPAPAIVKIDTDGKPHIASDFAPSTATEGNMIVTLSETGNAFGWTIGQSTQRVWTLRPTKGAKFVSAVSRASHEPVASIGKVLGDRAVLYKYISPNLAVLIAQSSTAIIVYLVDAVTGAVLHTSPHEGVVEGSSVPAVLSENWFAYAFTSRDPETSAPSTQLIISELYESSASNDRGALLARSNYSEFSADAGYKPYVISQAYTVPERISNMAVTQTTQGITSRQVLVTLPESNSIAAVFREILNARRPTEREPTKDEMEEGLFRYTPSLDLNPGAYVSHARDVLGIKQILTTPSLLESTSIMFAFGHDIFGTEVVPSGAFDVLGKGFNRIALMATIVALFIGVMAIRPFVRTRTVEGRWKA